MWSKRRKQKGLALLSVLFILVLLTTLAVYMTEDEFMALKRLSNVREAEQSFQVAVSLEDFAGKVVARDMAEDENKRNRGEEANDNLKEAHFTDAWRASLGNITVDDGNAGVVIVDALSKFNLNNVFRVRPPSGGAAARVTVSGGDKTEEEIWFNAYTQLLDVLGLERSLALTLADWMDDGDDQINADSVDDLDYRGFEIPYRAPNRPLASIGELKYIQGYDDEVIEALLPFVTVLPIGDLNAPTRTKINANTCPQELYNLLVDPTINDTPFDASDLENIVQARDALSAGWPTHAEFLTGYSTAVPQRTDTNTQNLFEVKSDYYEITTAVEFGRVKYKTNALILRALEDDPQGTTKKAVAKIIRRERVFL